MAYNIVTIAGSLRKDSFSLKIANALAKLAPASLKLEVITPAGVSFFNQDLEGAPPADWLSFREKIQKSDGVIFVTPEYNRAIPGVLKNAIDVASRPYGKSSFNGKPVGIISNSPGPLGGVSAAKTLQNILPGISGPIMQQPEAYLNAVGDAFDADGNFDQGLPEARAPGLYRRVCGTRGEASRLRPLDPWHARTGPGMPIGGGSGGN
ncbi:chromate reductase [Bradyrhizobium sp. LB7.1]